MDTQLLKEIDSWIEQNRKNIVKDLIHIVNIKSISDADSEIKPFGQGCRDVLDEMLKIGRERGFSTENYDYQVGSIQLNKGKSTIGIWSHLDVVAEADGWEYEPFNSIEKENFVIGR